MAIKSLYAPSERVVYSTESFDKGIAELRGVGATDLAQTWLVQEERGRMENGRSVYGRVREGTILAAPGRLFNSDSPVRMLLRKGIPAYYPKEATDANRQGNWFYVGDKKYAGNLNNEVVQGMLIEDSSLDGNTLVMPIKDFQKLRTAKFFFGGEGTEEEIKQKVKNAQDYFIREKADLEAIRAYLPAIDEIKDKDDVIATQFWVGDADNDFQLGGDDRSLNSASSVFGVC